MKNNLWFQKWHKELGSIFTQKVEINPLYIPNLGGLFRGSF